MNQKLPLAEQLKNLEQVQEIDLKIDSVKNSQNSLPLSLKQADAALVILNSQFNAKSLKMNELEKAQRQTVAALELNQDRMTRASQKLEAVHNSQEFQAANKEIDQLKKLNLSLDEQSKKSVEELTSLQKEVTEMKTRMEEMQQSRDSQASVLTAQETQLHTEVQALNAEREKFSIQVEARILTQYNRVRGARSGIGIVPAVGGRCKACNMMLPPQLFNEIQRGTVLHSCPSCHRLLFAT